MPTVTLLNMTVYICTYVRCFVHKPVVKKKTGKRRPQIWLHPQCRPQWSRVYPKAMASLHCALCKYKKKWYLYKTAKLWKIVHNLKNQRYEIKSDIKKKLLQLRMYVNVSNDYKNLLALTIVHAFLGHQFYFYTFTGPHNFYKA